MKAVQKVFLYMILFGVSLFLATTSAMAGGKVKTQSAAQLSANWWQWQQEYYPGADFGVGYVDCGLGQSGEIWYLGGTGVSGTYVRECEHSVPVGKQMFFPIVNANWANAPGEEDTTVEEKRMILDWFLSEYDEVIPLEACNINAMLDGEPVIFSGTPIQRVQSPPFEYTYEGDPASVPDTEAVSDGFWVLTPKLNRGEHTIQFTGGLCDSSTGASIGFDFDVTYILHVSK